MSLDSDMQLLSRVKLFAGFQPEHLRLLAFGAEARTLGQGTRLFAEGAMSDGGYVIVHGAIELKTENGSLINVHGPGALLGEMALISDVTRPATAHALEPTEVLKITRPLFKRMLTEYPELAELLHQRISEDVVEFVDRLDHIRTKLDHSSALIEKQEASRASSEKSEVAER